MNKILSSTSKDYISLILNYFKDDLFLKNINNKEELTECEIDVFSNNLFENLYNNCLYFYHLHKKQNIESDEKKYLFSEIVNILDIINETSTFYFLKNDFLKSVLIYLVYSLKENRIITIEIVLKIFFGFVEIFPSKNIKRIDNDVIQFEIDIIETIKKLIDKYISNFEIDLKIPQDENNFADIIDYLKINTNILPLYLKGFINYNELSTQKKFFIIKIYNYFKKINPYSEENKNINFYLFQGYSLYEIRMNNINAEMMLKIVIQLLEKKNNNEFINELNRINFNLEFDIPKIHDIFYDTEKYYEDIFRQLRFYLTQYKKANQYKVCKIINSKIYRILWLNLSKLLLLNLREDDIKQDNIKIIFYFISNIFNPDIQDDSFEFREDVIPKLFSQCPISSELLNNQEIYEIIDNYKYYPDFKKNNNFTQIFINLLNKEIIDDPKIIKELENQQSIRYELNNIKNCYNHIPFPLLQDYLNTVDLKKTFLGNSCFESALYTFYKNCWQYLDDMGDVEKELFFLNLRKNIVPDSFN